MYWNFASTIQRLNVHQITLALLHFSLNVTTISLIFHNLQLICISQTSLAQWLFQMKDLSIFFHCIQFNI